MVRVLITQPRGKENLVKAFEEAGALQVFHLANADLVIPVVDEELPFFASNTQYFEQLGKKVAVCNEMTIQKCRDKAEFYRTCRRMDFLTPETMQDELIVKPRFGKASKGIIRLDKSYIVQQYIKHPEVSIDYFGDWQGKYVSAVARYRKGVVNGESTEMELVSNFDYSEVNRMGEFFKFVGHVVIQGFWTGEKLIFSEVNPRFGGGSWMTFKYFNSPKWLVENYKN